MKEQIFYQFLVVMMLLSSSQIQGERCDDIGIEFLRGCPDSIDKELPTPPRPSQDCCTLVRIIGMKCICEVINKRIEAVIDMQKLVNVAAACGSPLAPGSHCGSKSLPTFFLPVNVIRFTIVFVGFANLINSFLHLISYKFYVMVS